MKKDKIIEYKKRAEEFLSKMTLEEKLSQMCNASKAIERLKIKQYNWWNEALHGVARAGVATVFPQAIGLSATFNSELMHQVGDIISTEGRAKYNEFAKIGDYNIYKGLTFWSPNINIFRDPRWGRGHETLGEDPCLTAKMATEYIKGVQGDDDNHLKAAACVKHFVAHSGPEQGRHGFNCDISLKDFYETYFPAFEKCIKDAQVEGVMGAYNSVNDEICNASERLIKKFLRGKMGFDGYFVSDCGALYDIYASFRRVSTAPEAAALAVKAGCNLNCGGVYGSLMVAINENLITEKEIDEVVLQLLITRLKVGLIDGEGCRFNSISISQNDTPEHHAISLKSAEQSMVLLKNDGLLPLNLEDVKTIGIVGPNANELSVLLGNYNGTPSEHFTMLDGIRKVFNKSRVLYGEGCHISRDNVESCAESNDRMSEAIIVAKNSDVVVVCVGLNPRLEGEEGDAFNSDLGGDKKDLSLPGYQNQLVEQMIAHGKKTIIVNLSGSAIDLSTANKANAVIQAWYPGQYGGLALANILCGKVNPSGKLPVTFYKDSNELPDFTDYSMNNRTYKYFSGSVIYPFGYGLSYTSFNLSNLKVSKLDNGNYYLYVDVSNVGDFDGREVVQIYAKNMLLNEKTPSYQLVAFESVEIEKGNKKTVEILIDEYWIKAVKENGERVLPNSCTLFVSNKLPDQNSLSIKII